MTRSSRNAAIFENQNSKGAIIRKPGSKKLYLLFYYQGKRVEKSSGLDDTPQNQRKARALLDQHMQRIALGTFVFAEAFANASEKEKAFFAEREGSIYQSDPRKLFFGAYAKRWRERIWESWEQGTKKEDYRKDLNRALPYFQDLSFFQINNVEVQRFVATLKHERGAHKGKPLSNQRIKNLLIPLRTIWQAGCDEYRWVLPDPFANPHRYLPKTRTRRRKGFRFEEWMRFLEHLDPWYHPIVELMILTGMIASEVAGLRKSDIRDGYIHIDNAIVRGREKDRAKTPYRRRRIPVTRAILKRLDALYSRSDGPYLVAGKKGGIFKASTLTSRPWKAAAKKSAIADKEPYSLRHTFASWALVLRIDPNRLVALMGHSTKKMVYETYGNYIEGLNEDAVKILRYFGEDFLQGDHQSAAGLSHSEYETLLCALLKAHKEKTSASTLPRFGERGGESRKASIRNLINFS